MNFGIKGIKRKSFKSNFSSASKEGGGGIVRFPVIF